MKMKSQDLALKLAASLAVALQAAAGLCSDVIAATNQTQAETLLRQLSPKVLPAPPKNPSNRFADHPAAAKLGQKFFIDPRFSGKLWDGDNDGTPQALGRKMQTGRVSCAGCHDPRRGFSDFRSVKHQISLAAGWGIRKTPSLLDVAQASVWMSDGKHDTLFGQIFSVIENPAEMNSSRYFVAKQIYKYYRAEYEAIFDEMPPLADPNRFPELSASETGCKFRGGKPSAPCEGPQRGGPGDQAEYDRLTPKDQMLVTQVVANMGKAIEAYLRKLSCGPSRFDAWVHGNPDALTGSEKRGAHLFVGKAKCIECHSGPYFSDQKFHNIGLVPQPVALLFIDLNDPGSAKGIPEGIENPLGSRGPYSDGDRKVYPTLEGQAKGGAFRTPGLRCVSKRASYFHTGQYLDLGTVVHHFNSGGKKHGFIGTSEIEPLGLSPSEQDDLEAFLQALDGPGPSEDFLTPQNNELPTDETLTANPKPHFRNTLSFAPNHFINQSRTSRW